jgi:hypothetical protein
MSQQIDKISDELFERLDASGDNGLVNVIVSSKDNGNNFDRVRDYFESSGLNYKSHEFIGAVSARMNSSDVYDLAKKDCVRYIDEDVEVKLV